MRIRLTHVLVLMALMLGAGVVGVQQYEAQRGPTAVPGLIVIDAPWLDAVAAEPLLRGWPEASLTWAPADDAPASPFGADFALRRREHGARGVLVQPPASVPGPPREAFDVVLEAGEDGPAAARTLANHLVDHAGTLPFVAVLSLDDASRLHLAEILRTLHLAAAQLPNFRRTSLVVLGVREPDSGRRLALRVDRGRSPRPARPALADLREDDW